MAVMLTQCDETAADRSAAVLRAIETMRTELGQAQPLADLARVGRYSRFHFHRIFREFTGITPARFLTALRMAQARRLLLRSAMTVADIGMTVGYTSLGTFTTQFTGLVGVSPARFREWARSLGDEPVRSRLPALRSMAPAGGGAVMALRGLPEADFLVVGRLLPDGNLRSRFRSSTLVCGAHAIRLPHAPPAKYRAFSVVVPAHVRLVDAFVDDRPGSYLIGDAELSLPPESRSPATIRVDLRAPRPTDLPVLAVTSVRWLLQTVAR